MKTSIFKKMAFALLFVLMFSSMSFATGGDLGGETYDGGSSKPYQISDAADLKAFAQLVNGGVQTGAYAVLTQDICLNACDENESVLKADGTLSDDASNFAQWTPIGTYEKPYKGTFDGNGHTIRGLYFNDESADCVGLFGYIYGSNAIVQNVGVVDSYFKGGYNVGGVVGYNYGTVSNVYNTGSVSGNDYVGGVVGQNDGTVSTVYNTGSVSGDYEVGGVVGYNDGGTVSNVYNTGSVSGNDYVGGVVGYSYHGTVSNVYNTGSVSGDYEVGGVVGYNDEGTVSNGFFNKAYYSGNAIGGGTGTANTVVGKTSTELANLTVGNGGDFPLLEGETKSPWITGSVDVDNAVCKFPYLQVFGEASQPQFNMPKVTITIIDIDGGAELGVVAVNPNSKISLADVQVMENGEILSLYKDVEGVPTEWNFENDVVTENVTLKAKYIGVLKGVYQIASAQDLMFFASIVNGGKTTASAVLTQDICLNACDENESVLKADGTLSDDASNFAQWTPIGTFVKPYNGMFDGNGHTIRGLYFNDESADYVGLFGYIYGSNAIVQNVGVVDSYLKGYRYVGGVVGGNGGGSISNVYNTGSVSGTGDYVGGVVGYSSNGTVSNVYNTGSVSGKNYVGGVVGYNYNGTVSNVYNTGSVSGNGIGVGGVVGRNSGTVSNGFFNTAYYSGDAIGAGSGTANTVVGKTSTELANLTVGNGGDFPLLKGETKSPWITGSVDVDNAVCKFPYLQVFGEASQPQFNMPKVTIIDIDGGAELGVVAVNPNSKISLADVQVMENGEILSLYKDVEGVPTEWNFENDVVTENVTLKVKYIGVLKGVYQIASAQDLMNFASIVNGGTTTASAVLTRDICLNACDENESVLKANGTLSDNASNFTQWTPIGTSEKPYKGTFDGNGHTIRGLYFNDENTDYVGLFGYIDESAKVQNVGVVDSYLKGYSMVGGVVGANWNGTVSNAYNTGSVSGTGTYVGGVVGYNDEGTVSNVYNTGTVSGTYYDVGGVVGANWNGTVSNAYNTGSVSGKTYVGGVVGYNDEGTVSNVYNTGIVSGNGNVGGVVGQNNSSGTVSNGFFNTAYYSGNAIGGGTGTAITVVGKTSTELAALNVTTAFKFAEGEENPWTAGSKVTGDGFVTYKFPYLTAFGAKSQPVLSPAIEFAAGNASATVYGATTGAVNIPADVEVSGDITFNRAFPDLTAEDAFSTIMLPFEPASKPADVTFYTIVSVSEVNGKWKVSAVVENGDIAANTPYLVRVASGTKSITFNGGMFKATEGEHSVTSGNWKFVGTYEYKAWPKNNPGIGKAYGFAGSNGNDPAIVGKFAKVGVGAYIYPMRAYLEYTAPAPAGRPAANGAKPAVASLPDEIDVVIVDKDETTGEETTKVVGSLNTRAGEIKFANDRWFDLNGRYLGNKKPTQKGAYYNNGKKVIVK